MPKFVADISVEGRGDAWATIEADDVMGVYKKIHETAFDHKCDIVVNDVMHIDEFMVQDMGLTLIPRGRT